MSKYKFRLLKADEIDVRVGQVINNQYKQGANLLLYKNARVDMDILDETVGSENWQRKHYAVKENMYCSVGIKCGDDWVWKDDCGVESNTEAEKGEASDSFKRACVNWGIGRELYTSPIIFVNAEVEEKNGRLKLKYNTKYYVKDIGYDDNRRINKLIICSKKGNNETIEYQLNSSKTSNTPTTKPITQQPKSSQQEMSLEEAKKVCFSRGNQANIPFGDLKDNQLKWVAQNSKGKYQQAAAVILMSRQEQQQSFVKELQEDNGSDEAPF